MSQSNNKQQLLRLALDIGIVRPADAAAVGIPREYLSRLAKDGDLVREESGLYRLPDFQPTEHQSLIEVSRKIPKGVICLLSALRFHNIGTQNPFDVWLAVENKSYVPKISYPPVRIVYFSGLALSQGVLQHEIGNLSIPVFNEAKTVVDCFKYRNKIGLDVALEALREGWRGKRFRMDEIYEYAEICRVKNVMHPYLESLV